MAEGYAIKLPAKFGYLYMEKTKKGRMRVKFIQGLDMPEHTMEQDIYIDKDDYYKPYVERYEQLY